MRDFLKKQKNHFDRFNENVKFTETVASLYAFDCFSKFIGDELQGRKILDLGCGFGRFGLKLAESTSAEVIGLDISDISVKKANSEAQKRGVGNFHAICDDFKTVNYKEYFDFVISINMLHHTDERDKIASNVFDSLKVGGAWIIIENNPVNPLFIPFFILIGQFRAHLTVPYLKSNRFSLTGLTRRNGFKIERIQRYGWFPTALYNYSKFFIKINYVLNTLPILREFAAFHLIKAIKR